MPTFFPGCHQLAERGFGEFNRLVGELAGNSFSRVKRAGSQHVDLPDIERRKRQRRNHVREQAYGRFRHAQAGHGLAEFVGNDVCEPFHSQLIGNDVVTSDSGWLPGA